LKNQALRHTAFDGVSLIIGYNIGKKKWEHPELGAPTVFGE
jgi:hypothetical protein